MKATMDAYGIITLSAETPAESWAMRQWADQALVRQEDTKRGELAHWRASMLVVDANPPEAAA